MNKDMVEEVARRTNLSVSACRELLESGWSYVERIDCTPKWEYQGLTR